MSLRRIAVLFIKDFKYAITSYFLIFAVVAPIAFTLIVNLLFGSLFSEKPKLGIFKPGNTKFVESFSTIESIHEQRNFSEKELKQAVAKGAQDVGILLPESFDTKIQEGNKIQISLYVWGQSLLKDRALIRSAFVHQVRKKSNQKIPIDLVMISLGDEENIPWKERFMPVIILLAIFIGGFTIPSSSLVMEKERRTIGAILTTPVTQSEIFVSKSAIAILISMVMGAFTLFLNNAFHGQFVLIIFLLFLGAVMASSFGLLLGAFINEMASLYTAIKGFGIIIYGPGTIAMFPQIPQWIGKVFPTYYVINPILAICQKGKSWSTIKFDVLILLGILIFLIFIVGIVTKKTKQQSE